MFDISVVHIQSCMGSFNKTFCYFIFSSAGVHNMCSKGAEAFPEALYGQTKKGWMVNQSWEDWLEVLLEYIITLDIP